MHHQPVAYSGTFCQLWRHIRRVSSLSLKLTEPNLTGSLDILVQTKHKIALAASYRGWTRKKWPQMFWNVRNNGAAKECGLLYLASIFSRYF